MLSKTPVQVRAVDAGGHTMLGMASADIEYLVLCLAAKQTGRD